MKINSILVVDDSKTDLELVSIACSTLDCEVESAKNPTEALKKYQADRHSIVLTDYMMEPINGIELIRELKKINPAVVCLIMTGYPDAKAIKAVEELGLTQMITKPIRPSILSEQLRVAFHKHQGATEQLGEIAILNRMDTCVALLGQSPAMSQVRKQVCELLKVQRPIFLEGPKGVRKLEIIQFIHGLGAYADSRMVICPCDKMTQEELEAGLISKKGEFGNLIKEAKHGTLVLNQIERIPIELQALLAKNMKAISEQCRVISWANGLIDDHLDAGEIDMELYFQLTLDIIHIPALSERPEDLEEIVRFVATSPKEFGLERKMESAEIDLLVAQLRSCDLPGNLRDLITRVKEAFAAIPQ